jgi:type I restriction enzyme S subunit
MKASGVPWLGYIPSEWEQKQARYIFKQAKDPVGIDPSKYELLSLTLRGIIPRSQVDGGKNPENYNTYQIVHENDLIMCLFDYDVTPRTVGRATTTGMVTGAYTNLRPLKGVSTRYYNYFFLALDTTKELLHLCTGLRNGISKPTFFSLNLPVPSYETQVRIANYLDEEIKKIDTLINKQERLLELLEEKRHTTIARAVTEGLNPQAELKNTGINWLPAVPAHWSVRKLGSLTRLVIGSTPSTQNSADFDGDLIWVTISDMQSKRIASSKQMLTASAVKNKNMEMVPKGSLLFSFKLSVGKVGYADVDLYTNEAIAAFLPNNKVLSEFLYYAAQTYFVNEANTNIYGAALFNQELLKRVRVVYPDIEEQKQIANYLDEHERKTKLLRSKILTQIAILKERRVSLISSVVTGKAKV